MLRTPLALDSPEYIENDCPAATKLRALGMENFFEAIIFVQDPRCSSSNPIHADCSWFSNERGIPASQALHAGGQSEIDGLAAKRAAMAFFAVGDGHPNPGQSFQVLREWVLGPKAC